MFSGEIQTKIKKDKR